MQKAALFGGTFNPVHLGHLRVAEEVREGFGLDRIWFIPAANPPHKENTDLAPAADRYEMLVRATEDNPAFAVSEAELRRPGRSYTIDTVDQFLSALGPASRCYLVMGADAFAEIETWKSYTAIFDRIDVIVLSRPTGGNRSRQIEELGKVIAGRISPAYTYDPAARGFVHPEKRVIYPFNVTPLDISATRIRTLAAGGASIRYLVPPAVAAYIDDKRLFV